MVELFSAALLSRFYINGYLYNGQVIAMVKFTKWVMPLGMISVIAYFAHVFIGQIEVVY